MLEASLIIVDECSMIDMPLMDKFLSRVPIGTRLVFLGDKDQLESVGPGNVFKEMIESGVIPVTILTESFRQEGKSTIIQNADKINERKPIWFLMIRSSFIRQKMMKKQLKLSRSSIGKNFQKKRKPGRRGSGTLPTSKGYEGRCRCIKSCPSGYRESEEVRLSGN